MAKNETGDKRPFLNRLLEDSRGNTLAIVAAALIPLIALMGSAIDIGRYHMTNMRLQQACDAAALAGRRVMTDGTADSTVTSEATKFFNFNFPQATYGAAAFIPSVTAGSNSTVIVSASTTIPTTIMSAFGFSTLPISVTCSAKQDFVNTDIVLVLDNTGSMKCAPSASASQQCSSEVTGSKMAAQRSAVMALYDALATAQTQLTAAGLRLRYGIVPYSGTVNVGKILYGMNNAYIRNPAPYQQQVCTGYNRNGNCNAYSYQPVSVSHTSTWFTNNWGGCIEERQTVSTITASSGYTIPTSAYDLNIDKIPTSDTATQWPPYDETAEQAESQSACPVAAKTLNVWARADLQTYMNSLKGNGGTYSDVGMIWGGRFISSDGIFGSQNPTTYKSMPVNKFIILMTDGYIDTGSTYYGAYGVEAYDHRASATPYPGDSVDTANHKQRFSMICNAVKGMNVSIWVIGFGQSVGGSLDSALQGCASNANQASIATDSTTLIARFTQIGNTIGSLRLTQ